MEYLYDVCVDIHIQYLYNDTIFKNLSIVYNIKNNKITFSIKVKEDVGVSKKSMQTRLGS